MSAATLTAPATRLGVQASSPPRVDADAALVAELLAHLDAQLDSARGLLQVVLEQGVAIRAREVDAVVRLAGILRGEMEHRQLLEETRSQLLARAGERLGIPIGEVTLERICVLMDQSEAETAHLRSAELRGLLRELRREHSCNRSLMQIELGFLDHLMGALALDGVSGYDLRGASTPIARARSHGSLHVLDLRA